VQLTASSEFDRPPNDTMALLPFADSCAIRRSRLRVSAAPWRVYAAPHDGEHPEEGSATTKPSATWRAGPSWNGSSGGRVVSR
jgi:hypothetical protein